MFHDGRWLRARVLTVLYCSISAGWNKSSASSIRYSVSGIRYPVSGVQFCICSRSSHSPRPHPANRQTRPSAWSSTDPLLATVCHWLPAAGCGLWPRLALAQSRHIVTALTALTSRRPLFHRESYPIDLAIHQPPLTLPTCSSSPPPPPPPPTPSSLLFCLCSGVKLLAEEV